MLIILQSERLPEFQASHFTNERFNQSNFLGDFRGDPGLRTTKGVDELAAVLFRATYMSSSYCILCIAYRA
jgi:hypothetical protein